MEWLVPVLVAIIGGPLMWGLHRFDKRNTEQHGQNLEVLKYIREDVKEVRKDVKEVRQELNDHINKVNV
jgi:cytochrome c-type biogenesis protein CcmH/NrfF